MSTTTTQKPKPATKKTSAAGTAKSKPATEPKPVKHDGIMSALAAFQAELPRVSKASTARDEGAEEGREYAYASLADISQKAMPLLGKHGLSFAVVTKLSKRGAFTLRYWLSHESGEVLGGAYPLPNPADVHPKELGSAISYARRYALCSVTGIAPGGEDDDAATVGDPAKPMHDGPTKDTRTRPTSPEAAEAAERAEQWLEAIRDAKTGDDLTAVYQQANSRGQASGPVIDALNARKSELRDAAAGQ